MVKKTDLHRSKVEVRTCGLGIGVFARQTIGAGEAVISLPQAFTTIRDRYTIQLGERRHQMYTSDPDDFVNHSCRPNCRLDVESSQFVALVQISPGQEVTFNYLSSEWEMVEPFTCVCEGRERLIRGYRFLSPEEQQELRPLVPRWLLATHARPSTS
ncbi:MAG: SET domain-containing protein-lysine N-methyltransferase [Acidimicrobiales bacterium]